MKRKTNLFYLSGDESNFLTFSNYGEALTGNFLATDWKLFPSRFLCLYIKYLDVDNIKTFNERKKQFIQYLTANYENKLAFLRDYCIENNISIEKTLNPLGYLMDALYRIQNNTDNNELKILSEYKGENLATNDDIKLYFVGDITEQDYNGTYTDIINIINSNDKPLGKVKFNYTIDKIAASTNETTLHGWDISDLGSFNVAPIFDDSNAKEYYINTFFKEISYNKNSSEDQIINEPNIKFNVLIPLFDYVNISLNTNDTQISETDDTYKINDTNSDSKIKNIPLGIWINDSVVELKRNIETGYSPAWSLMLGTQFKPFPYSRKMNIEHADTSTNSDAFATYSQVLMRQNQLLQKFEDVLGKITILQNKYNSLESKLNTVGTSYTSDRLRTEMINFEEYQQNKLNAFKDEVYSYILNKWKGYIG